jgi:tetratricopeptide (TPR) repeat protein
MSARLDLALLLFQQSRYELADRELRAELAVDPANVLAHALLALCLAEREQLDQAAHEAEEAVRLGPLMSFAHYTMARVLFDRRRLKESEAAIAMAIQLDPEDADFASLLASIRFHQRRWSDALEAAERGLAFDAHHVGCTNLRAMALIKLGRKQEAGATIDAALARDPENPVTHANPGWALLEQGEPARALHHFREALRLDPQGEWARMGIVEALKAKHILYRLMLRYFLWTSKLSGKAQWAVILGLVFGQNLLRRVTVQVPALAPFAGPMLLLVFVFLILTWIADPLFNLLLRLNRFGRLALSHEQVVASNWLGGCILAALASLATYGALRAWRWDCPELLIAGINFGFLVLPVAATFGFEPGWPRRVLGLFTILLALAGPGTALLSMVVTRPEQLLSLAEIHRNYFMGVILSSWLAVGLRSVKPV